MPKYQPDNTLLWGKLSVLCVCGIYLLLLFREGWVHGSATQERDRRFALTCIEREEVRSKFPYECEQAQFIGYWHAEITGFKHAGNVLYNKLESAGWFTVAVVVVGFIVSYLLMWVASAGQRMNEVATMIRRQSSGVYVEEIDEDNNLRRPRIAY
jgi:hypothetical protein